MDKQLAIVAQSYDNAIDSGRKGNNGDPYKDLPDYITKDQDYIIYKQLQDSGMMIDSDRKEIYEYLAPAEGMKFIDLGCCLNLMFKGYDNWPSTYHGVDISSKTVELLTEFVEKKDLQIGSLYCCSMHETPYETSFFDIGACIGSLEYFDKEFVERVVIEAHRIIKPNGKFVLDVPDLGSPECRIAMLVEEYLGRPNRYNIPAQEFENMLSYYFIIETKEKVGSMFQYFMRNKYKI